MKVDLGDLKRIYPLLEENISNVRDNYLMIDNDGVTIALSGSLFYRDVNLYMKSK